MAEHVSNILTIDVEDYFHASALRIPNSAWNRLGDRVTRNTAALLGILSEYEVKATFFVLGWVAEKHPAIVRQIASEGHEVACHGYSHELIYQQTKERFTEETRTAKALLEDISGRAVIGYRAASFSIVKQSLWALDVIAELGFLYDSSIFPVRHDRYGIVGARREPHVRSTSGGRYLVEIPPSVLSLGPYRLPFAGGGYFRLYPYTFTRWGMRRVNGEGLPVVVYVHPWEIDAQHPRVSAGLLTKFRHFVNIKHVGARLGRLLSEFSFVPMQELAASFGCDVTAAPDIALPARS